MIRVGIFTDTHYAKDFDSHSTRTHWQSGDKVRKILDALNDEADVFIQLGDLINICGDHEGDMANIAFMMRILNENPKKCYTVLGNHDVEATKKKVFLPEQEKGYYFFDLDGVRFIVLDGNFTSDGVSYEDAEWDWTDSLIPAEEMAWLKATLDETPGKAIVLVHQNLDPRPGDPHIVRNADAVRAILEESGKVSYVFQGHCHTGCRGEYNGIVYHAFRALCEKNNIPCAILTVDGGDVRIEEKELYQA